MKILLPGYILLPLTPLLFFVKRRWLFYATVFFIPFNASAVVYFPSISYGLQIPYLLAMVWIARIGVDTIWKRITWEEYLGVLTQKAPWTLILFVTLCVLSLAIPQMGLSSLVHPVEEPFHVHGILAPSRTNLTQLAYLLFMAVFFFATALETHLLRDPLKPLKVLVFSLLFSEGWGVLQYLLRLLHLPYPHELFNNNPAFYQGWNQTIWGHIPRMCSVATEPSIFSGFLFAVLPLLVYALTKKIKITPFDFLAFTLGILCSFLTFSTTALIGLILLIFLGLLLTIYTSPWEKKGGITLGLLTAGGMVLIAYATFTSPLGHALEIVTLKKLTTVSGMARLEGATLGLQLVYSHPLLGVGWGSNRTFDLVTNLLSNVGLLGTASFFIFVYLVVVPCLKESTNPSIHRGIALAILIDLLLLTLSIPDIIQLHLWLLMGICCGVRPLIINRAHPPYLQNR